LTEENPRKIRIFSYEDVQAEIPIPYYRVLNNFWHIYEVVVYTERKGNIHWNVRVA